MNEIILHGTGQPLGLTIQNYPNLYTNDALAALNQVVFHDECRQDALRTIEDICTLSDPNLETFVFGDFYTRITLERLKLVNKLGLNMVEIEHFALIKLVAGCVELLLCVKPSPFYYEYGYLCFRIMIISLNACLLKYANHLDPNFALLKDGFEHSKASISFLWIACASFLTIELTGSARQILGLYVGPPSKWNITLLEKHKLESLLDILYVDRKNFTIALKGTRSLGLSGFMYVLWKFVETERTSMNNYEQKLLGPYNQILHRYYLVLPKFKYELEATQLVCRLVDMPPCTLKPDGPVDLEDSKNVVRSYIQHLEHTNEIDIPQYLRFMAFFEPFMILGCEDLITGAFKATMQAVWRWFLLPGWGPNQPARILIAVMECFYEIFGRIYRRPPSGEDPFQSWVVDFLKSIIDSDIVEAILRAALHSTIPMEENFKHDSICRSPECPSHGTSNYRNMPRMLERIAYLSLDLISGTPCDTFVHHLVRESVHLGYWRRYLAFFGSCGLLDPSHKNCAMYHICAFRVGEFLEEMLEEEWKEKLLEMQAYGVCSNPRCPFPFGAEFTVFNHGNAPFCSRRCQEISSTYAWQRHSNMVDETFWGRARQLLIDPVDPLEYVFNSDTYSGLDSSDSSDLDAI
ncbi:hypothetical protein RSOL_115360 [Rhizoctonia solani AG-3 Rhs1AP]|uniref:Uncharacterized protein n=1 Tax=Rhizoctonia solani AG-3 Rhs1AP TaxID=1086054 RepID=X8J090_9AGAM|nr:hypothetical protein RSOL_115360 [Rhizoctonia solani AG-3 Rhs1AP]